MEPKAAKRHNQKSKLAQFKPGQVGLGNIRFYKEEMLDLTKIKPDPDNPNVMEEAQKAGLTKGMQQFGFLQPIVVDQWNVICDGHNRVEQLLAQGIRRAPGYRITLKDPGERRLIRAMMNQLHGKNDPDKYAFELKAIMDEGRLDMLSSILAQPKEDFLHLMERRDLFEFAREDITSDDQAQDILKGPAITKPGDLWELGPHRLLCGDCTKADDVKALLDGVKVHQLNCDPPYGVDYGEKSQYLHDHNKTNRTIRDSIENDANIENYREFFASFLKLIPWADYNTAYIFMSGQELHNLRLALEDAGMNWGDYLIWVKNIHVLGRKDYNAQHEFITYGWKKRHKFYGAFSTTVLNYDKPQKSPLHPTQKPVELIARLITDGTQPGQVVYDAFGGSGSTLIACEDTGRICRIMETKPRYCDVIIRRWEKKTGQKAVLLRNVAGSGPDHPADHAKKMTGGRVKDQ